MIARLALIAALLLGASAAHAGDTRARARALYDRGMAHYNVGDYDAAVGEFKQAYELARAPGLLFNLAQACRLGKHNEEALRFYRSYLRERPGAPNRKDVLAFIAEVERAPAPPPPPAVATPAPAPVEAAPVVEPPPAPSEPAPARVEAPPPPVVTPPPIVAATPPRAPRRAPYIAGSVVLGGIGLAALGTAAGFAVNANDASSSISGATAWSGDLQRRWDDGQRDSQVATALFVVGGVATGVAVVLAVVAARKGPRKLALSPAGVGALGWSCAF